MTRRVTKPGERPLACVVSVRGGPLLRTLGDAGDYIATLSEGDLQRNAWHHAIEQLTAAAHDAVSIEAATEAVRGALFLQCRLVLGDPTPTHAGKIRPQTKKKPATL